MTKKISGEKNKTILENQTITEPVTISDCENCQIVNCDFSSNEKKKAMLHLSDCRGCTVSKCKFHGKDTVGVGLKIDGPNTKDNIVEDSEWFNLKFRKGNGGEPVRLGNSRVSHLVFNTIVRNCKFKDLSADVETISIKSCGNTIEHCTQENCKSSFCIRHGHTNIIQDNEFVGEGGIRVYNKDNIIRRNRFKDNNSKDFPPLTIDYGDTEHEPFEGTSGSSKGHASYVQVRKNEVSENTFDNCRICVRWGKRPRKYMPVGVKFHNNKVIADKVRSIVFEFPNRANLEGNEGAENEVTGDKARVNDMIGKWFKGSPPTERRTDDEDEGDEAGEGEGEIPTGPDPVIEPAIETEEVDRLCAVCEETGEGLDAKVKLSIHLCAEHAPEAEEMLQQFLTELKAKEKEKLQEPEG
jgi:hypothetical protein